MTFVATVVATLGPTGTALLGSAIVGGIGASKQASAAKEAAQTQLQGTQYAANIQKQMFDLINQQQEPYRIAGGKGLTAIQEMLPYFTKQPTAADVLAMPGAQFGLTQGLGAAGQGMNVLSPGSNVDIARTKFGADYLANVLYPQYTQQQTNIYNRLASLAGLGQASAGQTTQAAMGTGSNLAQLAIGGASALAGRGRDNAPSGTVPGASGPGGVPRYVAGRPECLGPIAAVPHPTGTARRTPRHPRTALAQAAA